MQEPEPGAEDFLHPGLSEVKADMPAETVPAVLVEQVVQGRCALFLGPDAAESAAGYRGLPTSWQLAEELAAACNYRGGYRPLPQIAQIYQHNLDRHSLVSFLRNQLDDPACSPLPIHELIARIPLAVVVQAGWDQLLVRALERRGVPHRTIYSAVDLPYARPDGRLVIYRPYGSLDRPETLVITEDDQLGMFYQLRGLKAKLADLIASNALLMVGYAPDYDSVFVRIYHEIRRELGEHRLPAFVVESLSRPADAPQWEARGIRPLVADPIPFLYGLAAAVAARQGRPIDLPELGELSQAAPVTSEDLAAQTAILGQVLEKLGVGDLVEQSELPLLSADQVRDIEAMQAAYERLSASVAPTADAAQVWLRQGNIEYARQNYATARRDYELALAIRPDLAEAYHNLHHVHLAEEHPDAALEAYQKAIALRPELALLPSRFRIDRVLGRGGIGVVYRAVDTETDQLVAVKLLDRAYMRTEQTIRRFRREADLLERLNHPNIVRYLDFQQYQGRYFMVMEYLGDQTLARVLAERGRLPIDQAADILDQACQAISFVHDHQIIHRDIKPANIFLVGGRAKLIDFGLAVNMAAGQPSALGQATGTVAYMAPEQVTGGPVDERTDVYALGTVAYEIITGLHPGQGAYRPASELVSGITYDLDIVLQVAREREPGQRYPTVQAFRQELGRVLSLQPASQRAPAWRRGLSRLERAIERVVSTAWPPLLAVVIASGLFFPRPLHLIGASLWSAMLLVMLGSWFRAWQVRQVGYPSLAPGGPLLSVALGVIATLLTFPLLSNTDLVGDTWLMRLLYYPIHLIIYGILAVMLGSLCFLTLLLGARLGQRLGLNPRGRTSLAYGAMLLVLLFCALLMWILFPSS